MAEVGDRLEIARKHLRDKGGYWWRSAAMACLIIEDRTGKQTILTIPHRFEALEPDGAIRFALDRARNDFWQRWREPGWRLAAVAAASLDDPE